MAIAMMWSGGKDCTLALDRLRRTDRHVRFLVNLYDAPSRRVRFHGVRRELIQRQAEQLGMPLLQRPTTPENFEQVYVDVLRTLVEHRITGVAFGDIHLTDVRGWYEERTTAAGLQHIEPLWKEDPTMLVDELINRGYLALITSVNDPTREDWLGRVLDARLASAIRASGIDPAGENGEYHTYVFDGPLFTEPISVLPGEIMEKDGHAQIDLF
jgi:diphthine-ammonia ligase